MKLQLYIQNQKLYPEYPIYSGIYVNILNVYLLSK